MTRPQVIDGWRITITIREGIPVTLTRAEIARVAAATLSRAGAPTGASLSMVLTDDAELTELNETHLGHEGPTDVLSFPLLPPEAFPPHAGRTSDPHAERRHDPHGAGAVSQSPSFVLPPRSRTHLGDIAISVERAAAQAAEGRGGQTSDVRWSTAHELRLLVTHGTLHICGWDHADPIEEAAMRALERLVLAGAAPGA